MPSPLPDTNPIERLTEGQLEALRLVARGLEQKQVAQELGISFDALRERLREARKSLGVGRTSEAANLVFHADRRLPADYTKDVDTSHVVAPKPVFPLPLGSPVEDEVHESHAIYGVSPAPRTGRPLYQSREIASFLKSPIGVLLMAVLATAALAVAISAVVQMVALFSELVSPTR